jgi:hypothetical protein
LQQINETRWMWKFSKFYKPTFWKVMFLKHCGLKNKEGKKFKNWDPLMLSMCHTYHAYKFIKHV